jgi:hypothetical protein
VLAIVGVGALDDLQKPESDETKCRRWLHANISIVRLDKAQKHHPGLSRKVPGKADKLAT